MNQTLLFSSAAITAGIAGTIGLYRYGYNNYNPKRTPKITLHKNSYNAWNEIHLDIGHNPNNNSHTKITHQNTDCLKSINRNLYFGNQNQRFRNLETIPIDGISTYKIAHYIDKNNLERLPKDCEKCNVHSIIEHNHKNIFGYETKVKNEVAWKDMKIIKKN